GNPRSSTAFTVLKMAVFAPMPRASTSSATTANPRLLFNVRKAKRTSWANSMSGPAWLFGEHARRDSLRPSRKPHHPLWPRRSHGRGASRRVVPPRVDLFHQDESSDQASAVALEARGVQAWFKARAARITRVPLRAMRAGAQFAVLEGAQLPSRE